MLETYMHLDNIHILQFSSQQFQIGKIKYFTSAVALKCELRASIYSSSAVLHARLYRTWKLSQWISPMVYLV